MDSVMDPSMAGMIAGGVHHLLVQYPNQAKLFTTFYAIAFMNAGFVILILGSKDAIRDLRVLQLLRDLVLFDLVYV